MKILSFVLSRFQLISSGAQLGSIGDFVAFGVLLLFWFCSRTLIVFGCCNALFMYCVKWLTLATSHKYINNITIIQYTHGPTTVPK